MMRVVAAVGEGAVDDFGDPELNEIMTAVRERPTLPLTLRCYTSSTYDYQNPEEGNSSRDSSLFHRYRNLKILQMLGLVPGDTRPALELFQRLLEKVKTGKDIIWFEDDTSEYWKGEGKSDSYEKGVAKGVDAIIPNVRSKEQRLKVKRESTKLLSNEKVVLIRPHHLMCMACNYRGPNDLTPLEEDNIFEIIEIMQKNPEIPIELVEGTTCMICPPCKMFDPEVNKCTGSIGISLRDELKDLYVLRKLGLKYGDVLPANKLYALLFERIKTPSEVCAFGEKESSSREWAPCGLMETGGYEHTREIGIFGTKK